jgi:adenylate cyclase
MHPREELLQGVIRDVLPPAAVLEQLERILSAPEFVASERMTAFLRFVVTEKLEGREDRIKQYTIATKVFERESGFDQQNDPVVRVQAAKVRRALQRYYFQEGCTDPIRIEIPKGTYVPLFSSIEAAEETVSSAMARTSRPPTVAVMPFANQTGDASQDYFAAGFSEDLSTELSRFRGVSVVAYYTTQQYAADTGDVGQVGRDLNADYLLTGSVRQFEPELRINIQLCGTMDGHQIWGERCHRQLTTSGVHQVQDEVIQSVLARVAGRYGAIHEALAPATRRVDHASLTGYEAVLRSLYYDKTMNPADYADAFAALQSVVVAEPNSAIVLARLAILYLDSYAFGLDAVQDAITEGVNYAERAVGLDRNSQDAQYAMAWACFVRRDHRGTVKAARRLVELNPGEAYLAGTGGWFLAMAGEYQEGLAIIERSHRLNPRCPTWFHLIPFLAHFEAREYEAALSEAKLLNIPELFWDPLLKAATLGQLGRIEEAQQFLKRLLTLRPDFAERPADYVGIFIMSDVLRQRILEGLGAVGLDQVA